MKIKTNITLQDKHFVNLFSYTPEVSGTYYLSIKQMMTRKMDRQYGAILGDMSCKSVMKEILAMTTLAMTTLAMTTSHAYSH